MNYQNKDSACVDSVRQVRFQTLLGTTLWPCMSGDSKATHSVVFSVRRLAFCCEFLSYQDHRRPDTKLSLMRGQYHGDRSWFWGQPVLGLHLGCAICQLYSFGQVTVQVSMGTSEDRIALTSSSYFKDIFKDMTESFHEFLIHNGYKTNVHTYWHWCQWGLHL